MKLLTPSTAVVYTPEMEPVTAIQMTYEGWHKLLECKYIPLRMYRPVKSTSDILGSNDHSVYVANIVDFEIVPYTVFNEAQGVKYTFLMLNRRGADLISEYADTDHAEHHINQLVKVLEAYIAGL